MELILLVLFLLSRRDMPWYVSTADLNMNNQLETYSLQNNILTISENGQALWQTPKEWRVDDYILADSNNDGQTEINLLVWKSGDYGASKPFWVQNSDNSVKNHFFLYQLEGQTVKSVWQSSNLDKPNCAAEIKDVDNDGKNELLVLEGEYAKKYHCQPKYKAIWRWGEWGFYNISRKKFDAFVILC